jgi:AcrR family transcriptional regulator
MMNAPATGIRIGRKYDQVIAGAREIFMRDGFDGAGVDDIAREAQVSKATLYSYFPDKRQLFVEVAKGECRRQADAAVAEIDTDAPPARVLRLAGLHILRFNLSPYGLAVYRIAIAESSRFPDLGREFYESGPKVVETALTDYFAKAVGRDELAIPDPVLAAHQFHELCRADLFRRHIYGVQTSATPAEVDRVVDGAVALFLALYAA